MKENRTVNELLKACRERAGMTQEALAKILIVERSTISKVETFVIKDPSYALVRQWCAATQGIDLMTLDMTGGLEGWKKLQKLEQMMRSMQDALNVASIQRKSNPIGVRSNVQDEEPSGINSAIRRTSEKLSLHSRLDT